MVRVVRIAMAVVVLIVVVASACGGSPTGIEGVAFSSGGPPLIEGAAVASGAPSLTEVTRPFSYAEVLVHENDLAGSVVGSAVTDAHGKFKLEVEPGTYVVALTTAYGYPLKETVHVTSGEYAQVGLILSMK